MRTISIWLSALAMTAAAAAPALAKDLPAGITRDEMVAYLQAKGLEAKRDADWKGVQIVKTAVDGVNFEVYFFDCNKSEQCTSLQFSAGWSLNNVPTSDMLDRWNREKRYMRAYLTEDKQSLYGEIDMIIAPNGSTALLDQDFVLWKDLLTKFKTHFSL